MKERLFSFKRFRVSHSRSSIPIGVDGVLIGAWASASGRRILDVGTGCGVIALMLAQRNGSAEIVGIDVDLPSVVEAGENFNASPWGNRLESIDCNVSDVAVRLGNFDAVVSNPPFYNAGVNPEVSSRMHARHQGDLSPESLIRHSVGILNEGGSLSMIVPSEMEVRLVATGEENGFTTSRICRVSHHDGAPFKRTMLEMRKSVGSGVKGEFSEISEDLVLFKPDGEPTDRHRELCGDFYLKF